MFADLWRIPKRLKTLLAFAGLTIFVLSGCAAKFVTRTSFDKPQLQQENIQKVAVFLFESTYIDMQAGSHISRLFELNLQQSGMYQIVERAEIEKVLRERGVPLSPAAPPLSLRQMGDLLKVDGVVFGSVSQYNRFNLGFTARGVSKKRPRPLVCFPDRGKVFCTFEPGGGRDGEGSSAGAASQASLNKRKKPAQKEMIFKPLAFILALALLKKA